MSLSVDSLQRSGGFAGAPVKREVTWVAGGETHTADVYVRRLSYQSAVSDIEAYVTSGDIAAARIAKCILDENGNPVFEVHDVTGIYEDGTPVMTEDEEGNSVERGGMVSSLVMALLAVIGDVNDLGKLIPTTMDD
jgi:hypothetical protein